ncbi:hypothetical protein SAMN05877838_2110 [Hoeflea halophila]|uniref:Uncharacterized protein n=1 Tax=Hoeflea halophila TaxID=714899 RepID=A0A286IB28_9HYPH|nr:hypothetical protein SAMN05877838_2110 [Hoeflea halophila]
MMGKVDCSDSFKQDAVTMVSGRGYAVADV